MDRRSFLRASCLGCAGIITLGALQGCATLPVVKGIAEEDRLRIPASAFAKGNVIVARDARLPYDIVVEKGPDGAYRALYLRCTHRDQPVTATPTGLYCPSHGSRFALDGSVLTGPAERPLLALPVAAEGDDLLITLKTKA